MVEYRTSVIVEIIGILPDADGILCCRNPSVLDSKSSKCMVQDNGSSLVIAFHMIWLTRKFSFLKKKIKSKQKVSYIH